MKVSFPRIRIPFSPVQSALKFSAVFGTTSLRSSISILPASFPPISMSNMTTRVSFVVRHASLAFWSPAGFGRRNFRLRSCLSFFHCVCCRRLCHPLRPMFLKYFKIFYKQMAQMQIMLVCFRLQVFYNRNQLWPTFKDIVLL